MQQSPENDKVSPASSKLPPPSTSEILDKLDEKLKDEIRKFVELMFENSQSISLEKKAEFGQLVRTPEARLLFAIYVDDYRVNSKKVSELTFYSLSQYFSIVLLECLLAEDFRPAKIIMNMMFTYYYEHDCDNLPFTNDTSLTESCLVKQPSSGGLPLANTRTSSPSTSSSVSQQQPSEPTKRSGSSFETSSHSDRAVPSDTPPRKPLKTYLYTLLKDQEIFKSIRFWTSAFYESVIIERNNHEIFVDRDRDGKNLSYEKREEELDCSKNITFGLLGSFIHNMSLLDLSYDFCHEFLDKHSTIAGLSDCQLEMLRSNLKRMFEENSLASPRAPAPTTRGEKLATFLQNFGNVLKQ